VLVRAFAYDSAEAMVRDQARLARSEGPDSIAGEITRDPDGRWRPVLLAGSFQRTAGGRAATPSWMSALRPSSEVRMDVTSYWEHLDRRTASIATAKAEENPNPSLAVVLPESALPALLSYVLATPETSIGVWRVEVIPMITARFKQPLHRLPAEPLAFTLRLQRRATATGASDHRAMLDANATLSARTRGAGGKIYPPFAPPLSGADWQEHYGRQTWNRLATAKRLYDPRNVLTPGPGIFAVRSAPQRG
jgi:FAD/FMN-containing dehydrogenase